LSHSSLNMKSAALEEVTEQIIQLFQREGTLTRKQIVDVLSIDNRRCYDIINVLAAVPPENPLIKKSTDQGTMVDSYTLGGKIIDHLKSLIIDTS